MRSMGQFEHQGSPSKHSAAGEAGITGAQAPTITLPKGGGAIRGIGEKFGANPVTGTGSMSVPIATSPGRSGFGPQLTLTYDSGTGNDLFGLGWGLALPSITRKADQGLPQYQDARASDVFILSGAEDLVPSLIAQNSVWISEQVEPRTVGTTRYQIQRYRPRIEGLFARIERWTNIGDPADSFWRSISPDNITTWYGLTPESRIADPDDAQRIFRWLICMSYDDKGNLITYSYEADRAEHFGHNLLAQAHEQHRTMDVRGTNRYLKRIRYGNQQPYLPTLTADQPWPEVPPATAWYFEVVFDYGEGHYLVSDQSDRISATSSVPPNTAPAHRTDPFSTYRAGFEVRTYRLCQRVLMFHHFPGEAGVGADCLVRSTDFTYSNQLHAGDEQTANYSLLLAVTQTSYKRRNDGYQRQSLPPVEFSYSQTIVDEVVQEVDAARLEHLPIGLDGIVYQWVDLHGEGLPGILSEQAGAWLYKRNLSPLSTTLAAATEQSAARVRFAPLETVSLKPHAARSHGAQFMDLAGDGLPDLVIMDGPSPGFYEHDGAEGWQPFRPFQSRVNRSMADPNLRFVDLDGDGHADILISEDHVFIWHQSLAEVGFGPARRVTQALDEAKGPRLVFADGTQSLYLADMSGDGLADLVRIGHSEVCYWPNLGYGRFGSRVTMDFPGHPEHPGCFDNPDQFDQQRVRLADIDGSGTTDLIYLHRKGVRLYFNQSGNRWSKPHLLSVFPRVDELASIVPIDLLGNGTACLVWSSPLPDASQRPMRYINLMGTQKPHLLVAIKNNLGAETQVQYAPSTKFYLQDKYAGRPWITRLPFPVHVVEKVTVTDRWRKTTFTTSYSYHHGHFDGKEREFRGFGRIEQIDVEAYGTFAASNAGSPYVSADKTLYQPPVKTVTWFHTGALLERDQILRQFASEYFPQWFAARQSSQDALGSFKEHLMPEPELATPDLSPTEWSEALRACKGIPLRQEIYELDVDALIRGVHEPVKLFSATQHSYQVQRVQPSAGNPHAVFHVTRRETITYHYELDLRSAKITPDPRIAHTLNLKIDAYGNIQQAVTIGYSRQAAMITSDPLMRDPLLADEAKASIRDCQAALQLAYVETHYTNDVPNPNHIQPDPDQYRLRVPCEELTYELTGINPTGAGAGRYFLREQLEQFALSERYPSHGNTPVEVEPIAYHHLPHQTRPQRRLVEHIRTLFFHDDLINPLPLGMLNARALPYESYTLALTTELLTTIFAAKLTPEVMAALTAKPTSGYLSGAEGVARFGASATDQYWRCSGVAGFKLDAPQHFFLPERYTDPFGNVTLLDYDPRDLYVRSSIDALGNTTRVTQFDFRVLAPRVIQDSNGNQSEVRFDTLGMPVVSALRGKQGEGDSLAGLADDALDVAPAALRSFFTDEYDEVRAKLLVGGAGKRWLYFFGEVIENGKAVWGQHPACAASIVREQHSADQQDSPVQASFEYSDGGGNILVKKVPVEPLLPHGALRWVASGKTIVNNKGKPVKQYEPYFSLAVVGHRFEEPQEIGVTPIFYYDALGRIVRMDAPDGSYRRVEFSPWHSASYDANDTLLEADNAWYTRMRASTVATERRAAERAAAHANTPALSMLDSLGRAVLAIAHNRTDGRDEKYATFTKLDAEGKPLWVQDARKNLVMRYTVPQQPGADPTVTYYPAYDSAGSLLYQHSMDAGERWMLSDAAGHPLFAWNSRGFRMRMTYDELRRQDSVFVQAGGDTTISGVPRSPVQPPEPEELVERRIYGEAYPDPTANLRGKLFRIYDSAGAMTNPRYDFKGNLLISNRRYARNYKAIPVWSALVNVNDLAQIAAAGEPLLEATPPPDQPDDLRRTQPANRRDDTRRQRLYPEL